MTYDFCTGTANRALKRSLNATLSRAGFTSSGEGKSVPTLLRALRSIQPWLAVIDTALPPGNIDELAAIIENDGLAAAVYIDTAGINLAHYVQLPWPVEESVLAAVAKTVCSEFARKKKLQKKVEELQGKLNERKNVDIAKGILARLYRLDEGEAYRALRRSSMEQRVTLAETASRVIENPGYLGTLSRLR